jgi:hypothetical protein
MQMEMFSAPVSLETLRLAALEPAIHIKDVKHALSLLKQGVRQKKCLNEQVWPFLKTQATSSRAPVKLVVSCLSTMVENLTATSFSLPKRESDLQLIIDLLLEMLVKSRTVKSKKAPYIFDKSLKIAEYLLFTDCEEYEEIGKVFYLTLWAGGLYSYHDVAVFMNSYWYHASEFPEIMIRFDSAITSLCSSRPKSLSNSASAFYNCVKLLESTEQQVKRSFERFYSNRLLNYCIALNSSLTLVILCDFSLDDALVKDVVMTANDRDWPIQFYLKKAILFFLSGASLETRARKRAAMLISELKGENDFKTEVTLTLISDIDSTVATEAVISATSIFKIGAVPEPINKKMEELLYTRKDNHLLSKAIMRFAQVHYK